MSKKTKLILNLAPTGMLPTKTMTPHVPISVSEIVDVCVRCSELGVSIVHLHARDEKGKPSYKKDIYAKLIAGIRDKCPNLIICVSLSGRDYPEFEFRSEPLFLEGDLKPDMASLTMSSLNFARTASVNEPATIQRLAETMLEKGIKPEIEVFDTGMVNYANYLIEKGLLAPPFYFNILLGNIATAQVDPLSLAAITALLPKQSYWAVGGIGNTQLAANTLGIIFGDGIRTGVEDNLWFDQNRHELASNYGLVERVKLLANIHERNIASPREVRDMLGLAF